jgi:hypothetical protein
MLNRSIGKTPFQIVYCCPPRHALDLVPLPTLSGLSIAAENMADRIKSIQEEVRQNLEASNAKYKTVADKKRRVQTFQEGDLVMVYLRKERLPVGAYNKMKDKKYGPFQILQKINDNTYVVNLPTDMAISPTFNVADLYEYHPLDMASSHLTHSGSSSFHAEETDVEQSTRGEEEQIPGGRANCRI